MFVFKAELALFLLMMNGVGMTCKKVNKLLCGAAKKQQHCQPAGKNDI